MPWTPKSKALLQQHSMTATASSRVSSDCVPVSITETVTSNVETLPSRFDRVSKGKQAFLVGLLVHKFGWTLGQDGNLYSPNPVDTAWGDRVN